MDVKALQTALNAHGADPALDVDGDSGPATRAAVIAFQRGAGLAPDGEAGPLTLAALGLTAAPVGAEPGGIAGPASAPSRRAVLKWMGIAASYLGLAEGPGEADNPKVVAFYAKAGHPEVRHDAVPWCAAFVGGVLHDAGLTGTGTLWALDYAKWGTKLPAPAVGAVGTKKRQGGGHVFFVAGFDAVNVWALGGNQGDRVCIERIPRNRVNSYAWPAGPPAPDMLDHGVQHSTASALSEA
jgi:uncharacterized protein (TIGR02594 family)